MSSTGIIPKTIKYYCKAEKTVCGNIADEKNISHPNIREVYAIVPGTSDSRAKDYRDLILELPNDPITDLKIINVSTAGSHERDRIYSAIIDNKYLVKITEKTFLDSIFHSGIDEKFKLKSQFVWAKFSGNPILVRVDSKDYKSCTQILEKQSLYISSKNLVPGTIYTNISDCDYLYLGKFPAYIHRGVYVYDGNERQGVYHDESISEGTIHVSILLTRYCKFYQLDNTAKTFQAFLKSKSLSSLMTSTDSMYSLEQKFDDFSLTASAPKFTKKRDAIIDYNRSEVIEFFQKRATEYMELVTAVMNSPKTEENHRYSRTDKWSTPNNRMRSDLVKILSMGDTSITKNPIIEAMQIPIKK